MHPTQHIALIQAQRSIADAIERQGAAVEALAKAKSADTSSEGWLTKKQAAAHEGFSVRHFDSLLEEGIYPPGERCKPTAHPRWTAKHLAEGRARYEAAGAAQRKRVDQIMRGGS